MSFFKKLTGMFSKEDKTDAQTATPANPYRKKYEHFQSLLASNNAVLEAMADMEEKLSGEYLFDRSYLDARITVIRERVKDIIDNLNAITRNKYAELDRRYAAITADIDAILKTRHTIQISDYTLPFDKITRDHADSVGSKAANLGEIGTKLSLPVPNGFGISAFAFKKFMDHNNFRDTIVEKIANLPLKDIDALAATSREIQDLIIHAELPHDIQKDILDAYAALCDLVGDKTAVSVRSSALQEDGEFSFAGQYSTFLNVQVDALIQRYKEVVASLFNQRALFYYKTKGFQDYDMVMPVGVLQMIDARAGGVMYSRDPNEPRRDVLIVSAAKGLGKTVVDGTVTPDTYTVSRSADMAILEKNISGQEAMVVCRASGGIAEQEIDQADRAKAALTDEEIKTLAGYALVLEKHFGGPQDIEWAIDRQGRPFILQSRPLRVFASEPARSVPRKVKGYTLLLDKGAIACKGIGFGRAHFVRFDEDLAGFPEGGVLVAKHTSTKFVTVMNKASAILTDVGGTTGHMASLAREFQVPTILDTEKATSVIAHGEEITVDAINCNIYRGTVEELKEFAQRKEEPFKETQLFKTLEKVLKEVVPLSLVDPAEKNFTAEACKTLHDITRFCHEKVMYELFDIEGTSADDVGAVKLVAGIPTDVWLLDLGGGIEGNPKYLYPQHIQSIPFSSFVKGLTSMQWPEPRAFDVQGFLGAIAHSATISEEEIRRTAEKSFAFITGNYMNFAIRLGYHLSMVEAYAGDNINDNYIKFFFKGGGAVIDRRLRRIRLIKEILKAMDFNVRDVDDVLEASFMKYKKETIAKKLEIMGKFTVYTKQLDMVMYNDMITDHYIEEFCNEHVFAADEPPAAEPQK